MQVLFFIKWSVISTVIILIPQIAVDSDRYGHFVSAPFNIIKYNMFTKHGPDLYGTEPWTYYFYNGFLNFNGAFILAIGVLPIRLLTRTFSPLKETRYQGLPYWMLHLALHLWLIVFGIQPHKEERFLFPIYPLLCLAAASTVDDLQKLYSIVFMKGRSRHYLDYTRWISIAIVFIFSVLSISRVLALYHNYYAPTAVWTRVAKIPQTEDSIDINDKIVSVCVGKEWHRYPSSFFLPNYKWELKYIRSEFKGMTNNTCFKLFLTYLLLC